MAFIALTPYSQLGKDTILIGANCVNGNDGDRAFQETLQIINPYENHEDIAEADDYCWNISMEYCNSIGNLLNKVHNVSYSSEYWKVLLLPWLSMFVQNLYDRYLRLCIVREGFPGAHIEIPDLSFDGVLYRKSSDVLANSHLHSVNVKLYSLLIEMMELTSCTKYLNVNCDNQEKVKHSLIHSVTMLRHSLRELVAMFSIHKGDMVFFEMWGDFLFLSHYFKCFQLGTPFLKDEKFCACELSRERIEIQGKDNEFENILSKFIKWALPFSFYEEYKERRQTARKFINKENIKKVFHGSIYWRHETLKFLLAEVRENGGKLIGWQHGAGYGHYMVTTTEKVEREIADFFITWGWSDKRTCAAIPLPNPRFARQIDRHSRKNNDILYIGSSGSMYMFRYQGYLMPEFVLLKYYPMKRLFIQTLRESVRSCILYRPYFADYGWKEKERMQQILPNIRFDTSKHVITGMRESSLVVIDQPGTSMLEAFIINVPTILFWDSGQTPMRKETEPYFRSLIDAGVLFHNSSEAAEKVNKIAENPETWWKSPIVQSARQEFCHFFALADPHWKRIWSEFLKKI